MLSCFDTHSVAYNPVMLVQMRFGVWFQNQFIVFD
jgi:hypothetical protein